MVSISLPQPDARPKGYYGVPPIHEPHWGWLISGYFFLGGISGSAAALSAFLRLFAGQKAAPVARLALWVSAGTILPCPLLLILDLRRPARFLNMVRAFRPSSPMSIGTWGFLVFNGLMSIQAALEVAEFLFLRSMKQPPFAFRVARGSLSALNAVAGFFVAGYTGVLLAATAVPLWSKSPALLASLFLSSSTSSGAAAVSLAHLLSGDNWDRQPNSHVQLPEQGARPPEDALHTFETIASLAKGVALISWLHSLGSTARPLQSGLLGYVVRDGVAGAGIALPLLVHAASRSLAPRQRRAARGLATALSLAGVFTLRAAIVEGGKLSANDPAATFDLTG